MWHQLWNRKKIKVCCDCYSPYSIICLVEKPAWIFVCWTYLFYYSKLEETFNPDEKCSSVEVHDLLWHHRSGKCIKCCRSHQNISFFIVVVDMAAHRKVWNVRRWRQICGFCNYIQRTTNKIWQRIWLPIKSVTTPRSSSRNFEIETFVVIICRFINRYNLFYPLLGTFTNEVIFHVIYENQRPFCKLG